MQYDAAFVQPVIFELDCAREGKRVWSGTWSRFLCMIRRRCGRTLAQEPESPPLGKFFRKVGEDFGEDLAFASLRASDARKPDP
jgi:hypothetical protein